MKVLGLIPARSGSKRLPGKNGELLGGVPLVGHAIFHASMSKVCDVVAVTTDSDKLAMYAEANGAVAIPRPEELSRGDQPMMLSVVRHALDDLRPKEFDAVCLLQPTSPFRTPADIRACLDLLLETGGDAVVSVTAAEEALAFQVRHARRLEEVPNVVVPNGAVFLARTRHLENGGNWFNGQVYGYAMPKDRSLDIDTAQDLQIARHLMERGRAG